MFVKIIYRHFVFNQEKYQVCKFRIYRHFVKSVNGSNFPVPVSTCAAERSFSGMKRLKTPLRSTISEERLSSLAILHIHEHKNVLIDNVVCEFSRRKGRRLILFLYKQLQHFSYFFPIFPAETVKVYDALIYTYIIITND